MESSFVQSKRKRNKLVHENYRYVFAKKTIDGNLIWVCEKRCECKGRVWTNAETNKVIKIVTPHTHTAPFYGIYVSGSEEKKKLARGTSLMNEVAAAPAGNFKKLIPLFDRVLVQRFVAETKTKGGIMIPEQAQSKVLNATVVAVGPGSRNQNGQLNPVSVKPGDSVLLPEYGGTKIVIDEKEYHLFRDGDILGKWE